MNCTNFELTASAYLDRQLNPQEEAEYRHHLSHCSACREVVTETQAVSFGLRNLRQPETPRELHSYILNAVERRATERYAFHKILFDWLLRLNPLPVSYGAGVIASAALFLVMLSGFKPIPIPAVGTIEATFVSAISGSYVEYASYNDVPATTNQEANSERYYQLPRVLDNSSLVGFGNTVHQDIGTQPMAALIEVEPDGSAKLVDMLNEPKDSALIEQFWWSLGERTFEPARVHGQPVTTKIVFVFERVDVTG